MPFGEVASQFSARIILSRLARALHNRLELIRIEFVNGIAVTNDIP